MHKPASLEIHSISAIFTELPKSIQTKYLKVYLNGLNAKVVVEEPQYFDRDFLSEFKHFYSTAAAGYSNLCRRLHFFSEEFDREDLENFCSGEAGAVLKFQNAYLGFSVIRPLGLTVLGRTVLSWYEDRHTEKNPRITTPSRLYKAHIGGIPLTVRGLAWQQQDQGVSACATISVWSALHSSAFDEHHAVPTTAEITIAAHRKISFGARVFPSYGLSIEQLKESIKELGLTPLVQPIQNPTKSPERFLAACASFIRSGYPVIAVGRHPTGQHAICIVGFRESSNQVEVEGIEYQDAGCDTLYVHDDNLGPNVRVKVELVPMQDDPSVKEIRLTPNPPTDQYGDEAHPDPLPKDYCFVPTELLIAVNNDLRTSADALNGKGLKVATLYNGLLQYISEKQSATPTPVSMNTSFMRLNDYLSDEMERIFSNDRKLLSKVRLTFLEQVRPMSLHLGIVRIGLNSIPSADVIYDTTDTDMNHPVIAVLTMNKVARDLTLLLQDNDYLPKAPIIEAY